MSPDSDAEPATNSTHQTYGDHAGNYLTSTQLSTAQFRTLLPLVDEYLTTDGRERTAFVQRVSLAVCGFNSALTVHGRQCFQKVWDGKEYDWESPSSWPSKRDDPKFHFVRKVCTGPAPIFDPPCAAREGSTALLVILLMISPGCTQLFRTAGPHPRYCGEASR